METVAVSNGLLVGLGGGGDPGDPGGDHDGSYCHGGGWKWVVSGMALQCALLGSGIHTSREGHHSSAVRKLPIHCIVSCRQQTKGMQVKCCVWCGEESAASCCERRVVEIRLR
jgi:hypothetical protein